MSKDRLFSVTGVSRRQGEIKVRFATEMTYVKNLGKAGHTDIELIDAGREMSKAELVEFLKTTPLYQNPEYQAAIDARAQLYAGKDTVKAVRTAKAKPSLESIRARAEAEATE